MSLEPVVFRQDPFDYNYLLDFNNLGGGCGNGQPGYGGGGGDKNAYQKSEQHHHPLDSTDKEPQSPSTENYTVDGGVYGFLYRQKKRHRTRYIKKKQDIEMQRMTRNAVERNRRKQMNDYLSVLKSIIPASYIQRGDQATIIGGAINYVKELEQLLQSLEAKKKLIIQQRQPHLSNSPIFSNFFSFPQYSSNATTESTPEQKHSVAVADIEVTVTESHANIKIMSKKVPKQLLKMVDGLHSLNLHVLHLNVTTAQDMVLQSFSVKIENNCKLRSVNKIAAEVYEMVAKIQQESSAP